MEQRLFKELKKITAKRRLKPVEDIHRSLDIVEHVLREAEDFKLTAEVVTWALKHMKENPRLDISDAIVLGLDEWVK
jgi:predicted DNA-binding protein